MMSLEASSEAVTPTAVDDLELLECLRKIGKGLIASGTAVGVVENTLAEISFAYGKEYELMALPNVIMIKVGSSPQARVDFAVQGLTSIQLNQVSEIVELVDKVKHKRFSLPQASQKVDQILAQKPRFNPLVIIMGYILSCVGLTLLFRPDLPSLIVTGIAGILVGLLTLLFRWQPRFDLLLPIFAAVLVSTLTFKLTDLGYIFGPANLLITPLIIFLPGALLTTGMIELASKHILSGSSRLIYGVVVLLLLFVGIAVGLAFSGLPSYLVYPYEAVVYPWWAPLLGTLLFGVGTFIRLSGANRDLFWMLLVLFIAMIGQSFGEQYVNSYVGAFLGALLMALSSEFIARSPRRTPALASQMLAFWFLVPGARGLLSVTSILSEDIQGAALGLGQVVILVTVISLGVLLGTLLISPNKYALVMPKVQIPNESRG
jgi:uncharacterized membrane protein YjjP (DUF1212 family)